MTDIKDAMADRKKADLEMRTLSVQAAEMEVNELQAKVNALQQVVDQSSINLEKAHTSKEAALKNVDGCNSLLHSVTHLHLHAQTLKKQSSQANALTVKTTTEVSDLIKNLIYAGEQVNLFAEMVYKKKQANPLISDELISVLEAANAYLNAAIAATLNAFEGCYISYSTAGDVVILTHLEEKKASILLERMTGDKTTLSAQTSDQPKSLQPLLVRAYKLAAKEYDRSFAAQEIVIQQLGDAQIKFETVTQNLRSQQAGLDAAMAAT